MQVKNFIAKSYKQGILFSEKCICLHTIITKMLNLKSIDLCCLVAILNCSISKLNALEIDNQLNHFLK